MKIPQFVSGSSVVLVTWLGATFFNDVPAQRYPKLDKTTAAEQELPAAALINTSPPSLASTSR